MTHVLGVIREFHTPRFAVIVDAIKEDSPDLSYDDDGSVRAGIDSGKYLMFCARWRVLYKGCEIAATYLGNCVYGSLDEFQDHREAAKYTRELRAQGSSAVCGSYFADMTRDVIHEARNYMHSHNLRA